MSWAECLSTTPTLEVGQLKSGASRGPLALRSTLEAVDPCSGLRTCQILVLPSLTLGALGKFLLLLFLREVGYERGTATDPGQFTPSLRSDLVG